MPSAVADAGKQTRYEQALIVLSLLAETWPACFKHDAETPLPLARGTFEQVQSELGDLVSEKVLHFAFSLYCKRITYRRALAEPGAMRVNLQGDPVELVSEPHAKCARGWLSARTAKPKGETNGSVRQAKS